MPKTGEDQEAAAPLEREGGRWVKGRSGNPAGRPRGTRNRVTAECAELLGLNSPEIMAKLIKMAKKGEPIALRLAVERLVPIRAARDRTVSFELPDVAKASDLAAAAAAVIEHAAAGDITLSEAKEFMQLLEAQRKVIETVDLAVRLEVLEGQLGQDGGGGAEGVSADVVARVRRIVDRRFER